MPSLSIPHHLLEAMVDQGLAGKPLEICGFLAGVRQGDRTVVRDVFPVDSVDQSAQTYLMNPLQQMKAEKAIRAVGLELVAIYHTHPDSEPFPSRTDVNQAFWEGTEDLLYPGVSYVIVGLADPQRPLARSFRINGRRIPEDIAEDLVEVV